MRDGIEDLLVYNCVRDGKRCNVLAAVAEIVRYGSLFDRSIDKLEL